MGTYARGCQYNREKADFKVSRATALVELGKLYTYHDLHDC